MTKQSRVVTALALAAISALLLTRAAIAQSAAGMSTPAPPIQGKTADGQPDVQGVWRPILPGTHSLNPALSSGNDFAQRISGVVQRNPSRIVDPPDGAIPYLPWAAAVQRQHAVDFENPSKPEHMDTATRCFTGVPRLYYFPAFRIIQPAGSVVFVWDDHHAYRVIPLDGRPHVPPQVKLWMGDGRGRWEGNTLVVDTTNLKAKSRLDVVGDFFSDSARMVERLTFTDANTMNYDATITDPTVFSRPWTMRVVQRRQADDEFWEWACNEGERNGLRSETTLKEGGRK